MTGVAGRLQIRVRNNRVADCFLYSQGSWFEKKITIDLLGASSTLVVYARRVFVEMPEGSLLNCPEGLCCIARRDLVARRVFVRSDW